MHQFCLVGGGAPRTTSGRAATSRAGRTRNTTTAYKAAPERARPGQARRDASSSERPRRSNNQVVIPVVAPARRRRASAASCKADISGWDNDTWDLADWYRGGLSGTPAPRCARQYPDPPPADRDPEPARDQPRPVHRAGAGAGRPVRRAGDQSRTCRRRCAAALRAKFGLDDPVWLRYLHWLVAMLHGDWGFSFASRVNVDTLILQRLPTTLFVIGAVADPGDR